MKIVMSMPVYNEELGLPGFIDELFTEFANEDLNIIVVNDCSKDNTKDVLPMLAQKYDGKFFPLTNEKNLGHGQTTLRGVNYALETFNFDTLITIDGDGQFIGKEVLAAYKKFLSTGCDVLEGNRIERGSPFFRKVSTLSSKILVTLACFKVPTDANTPLRFYKQNIAKKVYSNTPKELLTPNLYISALSRILKLNIAQTQVQFIPARGADKAGSTWKQKFASLPSKRFMKFCLQATSQWLNVSLKNLARARRLR